MVNYLALLGWSPGDDREVFTVPDLIREFTLERVNSSNAVFDVAKLGWMNGQYISQVPAGELRLSIREALQIRGCWQEELDMERRDFFFALIELWQSRSRTINDLADNVTPFLSEAFAYQPDALKEHIHSKDLLGGVQALREALMQVDPWAADEIEGTLREVAAGLDMEAASLIHALRLALTGKKVSPGLFEVVEMMDREKTRSRIDRLLRYLKKLADARDKRETQMARA